MSCLEIVIANQLLDYRETHEGVYNEFVQKEAEKN